MPFQRDKPSLHTETSNLSEKYIYTLTHLLLYNYSIVQIVNYTNIYDNAFCGIRAHEPFKHQPQ